MLKRSHCIVASSILLLGLAGCGESQEQAKESHQTGFPGQFTAGGLTSGEVMAKNGTLQAKPDAQGSPVFVPAKAPAQSQAAPQSAAPSPEQARGGSDTGTAQVKTEGTPGIPEGSGGNVSGTEMGGTTPDAAATENPPAPSSSSGGSSAESEKASKEAEAKAKAEKEKQQLAAAMDRVAQRWQETAAQRGWQTESADSSGGTGDMNMGQSETSAIGLPTVIRSEKLGTAPPSEDIKQPAKAASN